jgi:hypothetical protein
MVNWERGVGAHGGRGGGQQQSKVYHPRRGT